MCRACHALYMRLWRRQNPPTPEQRLKSNCRTYAHVYLKRGVIERQSCQVCGAESAEMHHPDYHQPLQVVWLCRDHHLAIHTDPELARSVENKTAPLHFQNHTRASRRLGA